MRKATATGKLIAFTGKDVVKPKNDPPTLSDFIRKMLHYPDSNEASQMIAEQAGLEFDRAHGARIEHLKLLQNDLDARFKASKARLEALETKLKNTPQTIKAGFAQKENDHG